MKAFDLFLKWTTEKQIKEDSEIMDLASREKQNPNMALAFLGGYNAAMKESGALSSPRPEAREEDYDVGSPREFAERLAWMTVNGEPDIEQWENHIRHRDAALSLLAAPKPEGQDAALRSIRATLKRPLENPMQSMEGAIRAALYEVEQALEPAAPAPGTKGEA